MTNQERFEMQEKRVKEAKEELREIAKVENLNTMHNQMVDQMKHISKLRVELAELLDKAYDAPDAEYEPNAAEILFGKIGL